MRDAGDHYEYIAMYVEDVMITSHKPEDIIRALKNPHKLKRKGTWVTKFHLRCDYFRDHMGTL